MIKNNPVRIRVPGSKSLTHRAFITAALGEGLSRIKGALMCEDTVHTLSTLRKIGAEVSSQNGTVKIRGVGGQFPAYDWVQEVFLGNSGTSVRLLCSVLCLSGGEYVVQGTKRMHQRPVGELVRVLRSLGAHIWYEGKENYLPLRIKGSGLSGGTVIVNGQESSQYVSSLLLSAPYATRDTEIVVKGRVVSRPYIEMTLKVMKKFGAVVCEERDGKFLVKSGHGYKGAEYEIEPDVSSASYFWAGAAITGRKIIIEGVDPANSAQGDIGFLKVLETMGCKVESREGSIILTGGRLEGTCLDMGDMPDMVPTLAAVAAYATGTTKITGVGHLRLKESDRLRAITEEWRKLGVHIEELDDGLVIEGGSGLRPCLVNAHNDHRIAMSLAVMQLKLPGIRIEGKECVSKSFPEFWDLWKSMKQGVNCLHTT